MNESYDMKIDDMDQSFHMKINVWHESEVDKVADKRSKWMKISQHESSRWDN
jgi:hypothetical protein